VIPDSKGLFRLRRKMRAVAAEKERETYLRRERRLRTAGAFRGHGSRYGGKIKLQGLLTVPAIVVYTHSNRRPFKRAAWRDRDDEKRRSLHDDPTGHHDDVRHDDVRQRRISSRKDRRLLTRRCLKWTGIPAAFGGSRSFYLP